MISPSVNAAAGIAGGAKLLNLNEKGREFPKGLRVMKEPKGGTTNQSHIHVEEDFSRVHLFGSQEPVQLKAVEVGQLVQGWSAWRRVRCGKVMGVPLLPMVVGVGVWQCRGSDPAAEVEVLGREGEGA